MTQKEKEKRYQRLRLRGNIRHLAYITKTFRYNKRKYHFLKFVNDGDTWLMICKFYGVHKQWWHYECFELEDWVDKAECGLISHLKKNTDSVCYTSSSRNIHLPDKKQK